MSDKKIPTRYKNSVIAHIMIKEASAAIDFYQEAFNAKEIFRIAKPNGNIIHAEILIEDAIIMLGDAEELFQDPQKLKGTTVGLHVYVEDVDALFLQAVKFGAIVIQNVTDMFYGDRMAMLKDPFGHIWVLLTHQMHMTPEEIKRNAEKLLNQ
jgi:PhnB protein